MQVPLQIVFRNMKPSKAITAKIRERVMWLESYGMGIISGRVVIEAPHKHHRSGNLYNVKIGLRHPGGEIFVTRRHPLHPEHRDLWVVIQDAFDGARRELEDTTRRRRRQVKHMVKPAHAVVSRLVAEAPVGSDAGEQNYGFLRSEDGRELYFHGSSVLNGRYDALDVGTEVRFAEEMGEDGPQASSVEIIGRQGRRFPTAVKKAA